MRLRMLKFKGIINLFYICVIDPNARILSQNTHKTHFFFQDFEYSTNQNSLYLHCNATFCKSKDYSAACEQTCHQKRLGGGNVVFDGPLENFDVSDAVRLTSGMHELIIWLNWELSDLLAANYCTDTV